MGHILLLIAFLPHCVFLLFVAIQIIAPTSKAKPPIANQIQCRTTNLITAIMPYKIAQIATKTKSFVIQYISEPKVPPGEIQ